MLVIKEKNNILLYILAAFKNVQKLESHKRNSWICFKLIISFKSFDGWNHFLNRIMQQRQLHVTFI